LSRNIKIKVMSKQPTPPNPNWPSKNPGKPSGPDRGNNHQKAPSKPTPPPAPAKKKVTYDYEKV
jgi:hypothetical protein